MSNGRSGRCADRTASLDLDRLEIRLPHLVPVPVGDQFGAETRAALLQQVLYFFSAGGEIGFADIGMQYALLVVETVERPVAQLCDEDFRLFGVVCADVQINIIHRPKGFGLLQIY